MEKIEKEITVSVTLSKTVKVKVGNESIQEAIEKQVLLPQYYMKDWNVDDFECVIE